MSPATLGQLELKPGEKILFYGIGNVGRQDDGIGIRLIEILEFEARAISKTVDFESNYQLNAEDALLISGYDVVVFVDASMEENAQAPFEVRILRGDSAEIAFSTHAMTTESIIGLCQLLYQKTPRTYLLTVPGYEWDVGDKLSKEAHINITLAREGILEMLSSCPAPHRF